MNTGKHMNIPKTQAKARTKTHYFSKVYALFILLISLMAMLNKITFH